MVVEALRKGEEVSRSLFEGTMQQCRDFVATLHPEQFYTVDICEDNGIIAERIK